MLRRSRLLHLVFALLFLPVSCSLADGSKRVSCQWNETTKQAWGDIAGRSSGLVIAAVEAAGFDTSRPYLNVEFAEGDDSYPGACWGSSIGVRGLKVRILGFDSLAGVVDYLDYQSSAAADDGSSIVLSGDRPPVYNSRVSEVLGVEGATQYCLNVDSCSSWNMIRVFRDCENVVVDLAYWEGDNTDRGRAAKASLAVTDSLLEALRSLGVCSPFEGVNLPEYRPKSAQS